MINQYLKNPLILGLLCSSIQAVCAFDGGEQALDDKPNHSQAKSCAYLHIQVANYTSDPIQIIEEKENHGYILSGSQIAKYIMPNKTAGWIMEQSIYGPGY